MRRSRPAEMLNDERFNENIMQYFAANKLEQLISILCHCSVFGIQSVIEMCAQNSNEIAPNCLFLLHISEVAICSTCVAERRKTTWFAKLIWIAKIICTHTHTLEICGTAKIFGEKCSSLPHVGNSMHVSARLNTYIACIFYRINSHISTIIFGLYFWSLAYSQNVIYGIVQACEQWVFIYNCITRTEE